MTKPQFINFVTQVAELLGRVPVFSHENEVAQVGQFDQFELHRSGVVRRRIYIIDHNDPRRTAESMRLEQRDRVPSRIDLDRVIDSLP
jgi:hypothetical protein